MSRIRGSFDFSAGSVASVESKGTLDSFDRYGIFTITLENGQVWQQLSGDDVLARWNQPASRYMVNISSGALGSYNLQVRNSPGLFKVRRVT